MFTNKLFNGIFGRIEPGLCRLTMNGNIAVRIKDSDGSCSYKAYNPKTGNLINCDTFVFDIGDDFFFVIPTNKVEPGDIILASGKPKYVKEATDKVIKVVDYQDSSIKDILPERHVFMGNTYFYGKIVSMFGSTNFLKGKKGADNMMKMYMMSQLFNTGKNNTGNQGMNPMMFMMLGGSGFDKMFDGIFGDEEETDSSSENTDKDGE